MASARYRRRLLVWGGSAALIALLLFVHEPVLLRVGAFLVVNEAPRRADLIHVLGGSFERLDYAVALYRQGYGRQLFITGSDDAAAYRAYVIGRGVPPAALRPAESWANSTYEEALELQEFLAGEGQGVGSVIVVSSPYHTRRARWTFQKVVGHQVRLQVAPVPFELSRQPRRWWVKSGALKAVTSEYLKNLYYYLKY